MASAELSDQPRPSLSQTLVRRNREIAEIRDEVKRAEAQVGTVQVKNKALLEQYSELDSEHFQQCGRAAVAEAKLAQLFNHATEMSERLESQRAAHHAEIQALERQAAHSQDQLRQAEASADSHRQRAEQISAEIDGHVEMLNDEQAALNQIQRAREAKRFGFSDAIGAEMQALRAIDDEIQTTEVLCKTRRDDVANARDKLGQLEAEHESEQRQHEAVSQRLRAAVADQATGVNRLQVLRDSARSNGINYAEWASWKHDDESVVPALAEIRAELDSAREQRDHAEEVLQRMQAQDLTTQGHAQSELDNARRQLQESLKEAAAAHGSEVSRLEDQVQATRQRADTEHQAELAHAAQVSRLKETLQCVDDQRVRDMATAQAEAGVCSDLIRQLEQLRSEVAPAEQRLVAFRVQEATAERKKQRADEEASARVAKLRGMIEDLWKNLRSHALRIEAQDTMVSSYFSKLQTGSGFHPPQRR